MTEGTTDGTEIFQCHQDSASGNRRRVIMATCRAHGAAGFTNLLVTKEDGLIVLPAGPQHHGISEATKHVRT